ncbi:MAG: NAD(P)-dependent oxidoreductase [Dehalococcoidia bacterium]|nr:NAD(P)-dependent oxidoreductase [Dehalococcoidia bacterium]
MGFCPEPDQPPSVVDLLSAVRDADAMLCMLTDNIDKGVLEAGSRLLVIANMAVGYNNIDIGAATARRIPVTNTPGILTETTADLAWALLLAVARRVVEGDRLVRSGQFKVWQPMLMLGSDVYGKTLGIVGMVYP